MTVGFSVRLTPTAADASRRRPAINVPLLTLCFLATLVAAGPCDIYASGGTPCVAAHSTTRALYSAYTGSLYQLKRGSDDSFCGGTTCLISIVYEQSGRRNHLTKGPPGSASHGPEPDGDFLSAAGGAPVTLNGQKAYGLFISPGSGYRNDATNGIAVGDAAEGIYAVLDGTHYNGGCCFDYGNAEVHNNDPGGGHMETIYFGTGTGFGTGAGPGPWVLADLEDGVFTSPNFQGVTASNPTITERFVTAIVKGQPGNQWAVRGGNAQPGAVSTFYSGVRPKAPGYNPMQKEGAIILGMGGDNSDGSQGTFYEGAMTSGYPSDATESAVQANIVAAKYATTAMTSGPSIAFQVGASFSFRATSPCCTTRYIAHSGATANTQVVTSSSPAALKLSASWTVRAGLANNHRLPYLTLTLAVRKLTEGTRKAASAREKVPAKLRRYNGYTRRAASVYGWKMPAELRRHEIDQVTRSKDDHRVNCAIQSRSLKNFDTNVSGAKLR
ncbi:family 54 glycoside hydrolase [Mycena polygramma]|nr:family 54 glycoside hydrolase [Mycena polygramma]